MALVVGNLDGVKVIVADGQRIITRKQAEANVAALRKRATVDLPASRAALKAEELLARAQGQVDQQIDAATKAADALDALIGKLG